MRNRTFENDSLPLTNPEASMRARVTVVLGLVAGGWIAACGGSDGGSSDLVAVDAGPEAAAFEAATDAPRDSSDAAAPGVCDPGAATSCAPRKCDPNLGCVQCTTDPDCTGADKFCIRGRCEACRTNANCGVAAPVCAPGDHQCHTSCIGDAAVSCKGDTPLCDTATGACVGCQTGTDCPPGRPLCEPTTKSCVQCTMSSECPTSRPRCFLGDFTCVECIATSDCGTGKICDPRERRCVAACSTDAQCGGTTPKCNTATSTCVQCLAGPDCAATPTTPLCATPRDRCVQCIKNTDCAPDAGASICDQDRCVQCKNDKDCPGLNPKCDNNQCQ